MGFDRVRRAGPEYEVLLHREGRRDEVRQDVVDIGFVERKEEGLGDHALSVIEFSSRVSTKILKGQRMKAKKIRFEVAKEAQA